LTKVKDCIKLKQQENFMETFKKLSVLLVLAISVTFMACSTIRGNGNKTSQERTVGEFNSVVLSGVARINIYFADNHRVVVTTDSDIQEVVTTTTANNVLNVDLKRNIKNGDMDITVDVYLPKIDMINLKGVGNIEIEEGEGLDLEIRHSGVGTINVEKYRVENASITYSGVGNIRIWATNSLSGNGSVLEELNTREVQE
jgi:predicted small secreted protein